MATAGGKIMNYVFSALAMIGAFVFLMEAVTDHRNVMVNRLMCFLFFIVSIICGGGLSPLVCT